ncbi:hypothetical protein, partial [Mesorhizobium sp.]|uniref:hypothetical protein n=1 Tax=Mesorhizobium sp. TaxID=1871066 RepID=UPI0025E092EE
IGGWSTASSPTSAPLPPCWRPADQPGKAIRASIRIAIRRARDMPKIRAFRKWLLAEIAGQ